MLTTLFKWIAGPAFLSSLFWCSGGNRAALLLAAWTVGIVVFVCSNVADRFLLVPVILAFGGAFGLIAVFAIPLTATVAANAATFVLFIVSLEVLKKRRFVHALTKHRTC
jgi:hypothetical protein